MLLGHRGLMPSLTACAFAAVAGWFVAPALGPGRGSGACARLRGWVHSVLCPLRGRCWAGWGRLLRRGGMPVWGCTNWRVAAAITADAVAATRLLAG